MTETSAILSGTINIDFTEIEGTNTCGIFYSLFEDYLYRTYELMYAENVEANMSSGKEFSVQLSDLRSGTTYYYRAYLCTNDNLYRLGEVKRFTTK